MLFQSCLEIYQWQLSDYLNEIFEFTPEGSISLRNNFSNLKQPFRNTKTGQKVLPVTGPSFWNQMPETLKKADNLNTFKLNLKSISSIKWLDFYWLYHYYLYYYYFYYLLSLLLLFFCHYYVINIISSSIVTLPILLLINTIFFSLLLFLLHLIFV